MTSQRKKALDDFTDINEKCVAVGCVNCYTIIATNCIIQYGICVALLLFLHVGETSRDFYFSIKEIYINISNKLNYGWNQNVKTRV